MRRIENMEGYKVIHSIPDLTNENKEEVKQGIVLKIHKLLQKRSKKAPHISI